MDHTGPMMDNLMFALKMKNSGNEISSECVRKAIELEEHRNIAITQLIAKRLQNYLDMAYAKSELHEVSVVKIVNHNHTSIWAEVRFTDVETKASKLTKAEFPTYAVMLNGV